MTHTDLIARLRKYYDEAMKSTYTRAQYVAAGNDAANALTAAHDENERLRKVLLELADCVDDGCYCSEMKMAAAVDEARAALDATDNT